MNLQSLRNIGLGILSLALVPAIVSAQEGKATLAVSSIKPTPSLAASVKPDKKLEMGRIVESLDSQLIDRINATRKFDVVGRSDLNDIIKEQDLGASGNVDAKTAAKAGKLTGAKYLLVTTVDDFEDYVETATFEGTGRSATKRVLRMSVVGKIYDSSTGKLLESVNLQTGNDAFKTIQQNSSYSVRDGDLSDDMMVAMARDHGRENRQSRRGCHLPREGPRQARQRGHDQSRRRWRRGRGRHVQRVCLGRGID